MSRPDSTFVTLAKAHNQTEAIQVRILLDRLQIPYRETNHFMTVVYGIASPILFGPIEFLIPAALEEKAKEAMAELFEVKHDELPDTCPACGTPTVVARLDCPGCGLHLA